MTREKELIIERLIKEGHITFAEGMILAQAESTSLPTLPHWPNQLSPNYPNPTQPWCPTAPLYPSMPPVWYTSSNKTIA